VLATEHDALLEAAFPGQDEVASLLREMSRLQFALRIGGVTDLERGRAALEQMISRFGSAMICGFLISSGRCTHRSASGKCTRQALDRVARPEGFEPPTPKFVAWCSIQLSYGRVEAKLWKVFLDPSRHSSFEVF
jgi:hypothetical protein